MFIKKIFEKYKNFCKRLDAAAPPDTDKEIRDRLMRRDDGCIFCKLGYVTPFGGNPVYKNNRLKLVRSIYGDYLICRFHYKLMYGDWSAPKITYDMESKVVKYLEDK